MALQQPVTNQLTGKNCVQVSKIPGPLCPALQAMSSSSSRLLDDEVGWHSDKRRKISARTWLLARTARLLPLLTSEQRARAVRSPEKQLNSLTVHAQRKRLALIPTFDRVAWPKDKNSIQYCFHVTWHLNLRFSLMTKGLLKERRCCRCCCISASERERKRIW